MSDEQVKALIERMGALGGCYVALVATLINSGAIQKDALIQRLELVSRGGTADGVNNNAVIQTVINQVRSL